MRHGKKFNHLGKKSGHRKAMLANMGSSLIKHKRINTTVAKAKALRVFLEPLVTKSKNDTGHNRRVVFRYLRDKDAVTATLLACEIAIAAKNNNSTFYEKLLGLYSKHSFYKEHLIALVKKGMDGAQQINKMMSNLRTNPVKEIDGSAVKFIYDYK